ncbi:MAG: sigma-70 family RNA polymerase sigma factor [Ruminococcaceae bacterium]|nr:sigma-70 family RNA polymerase sigma factor [Oscillospiraceae bacterium]
MKIILIKIREKLKKLFEGECFYINTSVTLPPPLESNEEARVIEGLISDNPETVQKCRDTLIAHNLRLVVYISKKFESTNIGTDDLVSIGTIGLVKAINTFNPSKNIKIATYASKCIENEILMFIRKTTPLKLEVSIDEPLNTDWDGNELLLGDILGSDADEVQKGIEAEEEKAIIYKAIEKLNDRDKEIICKRFGLYGKKELTQKELADTMGISQSYISRLEKRIINQLKRDIIKETGMF